MIDNIYKVLPWVFALVLTVNLLFLDYLLATNQKSQTTPVASLSTVGQTIPIPTTVARQSTQCPADCVQTIQEEVNQAITNLPTPSTSLRASSIPATTNKVSYFPIASSGSTDKTVWTDISGTDFYFNLSDYTGSKNVQWEVSLQSSSDTVYIRLYDVTNLRGVDGSEQSTNSTTYTLLRSGNLTIWNGNNLYRIQAKGVNGNFAYFTSPRLKILY